MYNYDYPVNYSNDYEFRMAIRNVFGMKMKKYDNDVDLITNDENNFDGEAMTKAMDYVYMITKDNPMFQELYVKAAGLMFSTNAPIGLSILFSYDYLKEFHACLKAFKANPENFAGDTVPTQMATLKNKLHR